MPLQSAARLTQSTRHRSTVSSAKKEYVNNITQLFLAWTVETSDVALLPHITFLN